MPDNSQTHIHLRKADYDYVVRQASRASVLCEFLSEPDTYAVDNNKAQRYQRELDAIQRVLVETINVIEPA